MEALRWTVILLGLWLVSGTAISLSHHPHWYVRGWDFPRVLIAALAFGCGAAYRALFFGERWYEIAFLAALGAVIAYQVSRIVAFTPLARKRVKQARGRPGDASFRLAISQRPDGERPLRPVALGHGRGGPGHRGDPRGGREMREIAAAGPIPTVVCGDLNDVAWSDTTRIFLRMSGLLDPRVGRGLYNTYNAGNPVFRFPLDHVFHSNHFKLFRLRRLPKVGSDHFPVLIELNLEPDAPAEQPSPRAEESDVRVAEEMVGRPVSGGG